MGSLFSRRTHASINPGLYVSSSPTNLQLQDSTTLSLPEFIESRCNSLLQEFKPAWWLFNGHMQTFYCVVGDFSKSDKVVYERHLLRLQDGGTLGLDFAGPDELEPDTPIIVVMHGLTGGSYESYVRSIVSSACTPKEMGGLGCRAVVVNFRGCAGVELTSAQFYSGGYTDDLRTALLYISNSYPQAKLLGLGFSLGANVITRYLGEEGEKSLLTSACVLGCPWDLVSNSDHLEENWFTRIVYSRAMAQNLKNLVKLHLDSLARFDPSPFTPHLEYILSPETNTLIGVDGHFTRFLGGSSPPFPFPSARAYYTWAASHRHIKDIRVPFLAINDRDDPIVRDLPIPVLDEASHAAVMVTRRGGHLGWFQRNRKAGRWAVERWIKQPVCDWLKAMAEEVIVEIKEGKAVEQVDGFTRDITNPKIGYRMVAEATVVGSAGATGLLAGL